MDLVPQFYIPVEKLVFNELGSLYVVFERRNNVTTTGKWSVTLKFQVRDCDPETGAVDDVSYPDTYQPESIEIFMGDYMLPSYFPQFETEWNGPGEVVTETFALSEIKSVKDAIELLQEQLGMKLADSNIKESARSQVNMTGTFVGGFKCFAKINLIVSDGVTMQVNVKSPSAELSDMLANAIH